MTLDDMKKYLRVEPEVTEDDALIESLVFAATDYVQRQTGKSYDGTQEIWNLVVKMLVAHWYENRGAEVSGNLSRISHSVDALVNHIATCGDY
jgi:uncharacterized phage protein (predicted DNA packaging)